MGPSDTQKNFAFSKTFCVNWSWEPCLTVIQASASIRNAKKDNLKNDFEESIENIEKAISRGVNPTKIEIKFEKMMEIFEEYKKVIFENFSEGTDEEQSNAFAESAEITDQVTKIKIRIYRRNSRTNL